MNKTVLILTLLSSVVAASETLPELLPQQDNPTINVVKNLIPIKENAFWVDEFVNSFALESKYGQYKDDSDIKLISPTKKVHSIKKSSATNRRELYKVISPERGMWEIQSNSVEDYQVQVDSDYGLAPYIQRKYFYTFERYKFEVGFVEKKQRIIELPERTIRAEVYVSMCRITNLLPANQGCMEYPLNTYVGPYFTNMVDLPSKHGVYEFRFRLFGERFWRESILKHTHLKKSPIYTEFWIDKEGKSVKALTAVDRKTILGNHPVQANYHVSDQEGRVTSRRYQLETSKQQFDVSSIYNNVSYLTIESQYSFRDVFFQPVFGLGPLACYTLESGIFEKDNCVRDEDTDYRGSLVVPLSQQEFVFDLLLEEVFKANGKLVSTSSAPPKRRQFSSSQKIGNFSTAFEIDIRENAIGGLVTSYKRRFEQLLRLLGFRHFKTKDLQSDCKGLTVGVRKVASNCLNGFESSYMFDKEEGRFAFILSRNGQGRLVIKFEIEEVSTVTRVNG